MLLPHGYENQGAEHSSARMERYPTIMCKTQHVHCRCNYASQLLPLNEKTIKTEFNVSQVVFSQRVYYVIPDVVSSMDELANGQFKRSIR